MESVVTAGYGGHTSPFKGNKVAGLKSSFRQNSFGKQIVPRVNDRTSCSLSKKGEVVLKR